MDTDHEIEFGSLDSAGVFRPFRRIRQAQIGACPHYIMDPQHYRENGICKCDDPNETIMAEWGYAWDPNLKRWECPAEEEDDT